MKPRKLIEIFESLLALKLLKRARPIAVNWGVTGRCNYQCPYCGIHEEVYDELDTASALDLVDQFAEAGVISTTFTGGEPLMRQDIGELLERARDRALTVSLNTNGRLVPDHLHALKLANTVNLSLDGDRKMVDTVKGEGAYEGVLKAADSLRGARIPFNLLCAISSQNADYLHEVIRFAEDWCVGVIFQPVISKTLGIQESNPLTPELDAYRRAIDHLISVKKQKSHLILNSMTGLRHLAHWPTPTKIPCAAGGLNCRVQPDGKVVLCGRMTMGYEAPDILKVGFRKAFNMLPPIGCSECWCASLIEMNYLSTFHPDVIINLLKHRNY